LPLPDLPKIIACSGSSKKRDRYRKYISRPFRQHCTFNPIHKIVELYDEKVALLERLLQSEREKVELLKNK